MQYIKKYEIGNILVSINSEFKFVTYETYKNFEINKDCNIDITIYIKSGNILDIFDANIDASQFTNFNTYYWFKKDGYWYLIFGYRGEKLSNQSYNDLWYLECNDTFNKCTLYVNNIDEDNFSYELFKRPWLQRLYVAYFSMKDSYIVHGALIEVNKIGCLFLGDSGAGKSTISNIFENYRYSVICDDRLILHIKENTIIGYGSPWNDKNIEYNRNKWIEVKYIFFLYKGKNNICSIKKFHEWFSLISPQLFDSKACSIINESRNRLKFCYTLFSNTKSFKLSFIPDVSITNFLENYLVQECEM